MAATKQKIAYNMPMSTIDAEKRLTTNMDPSKPTPKEHKVLNANVSMIARDDFSIYASYC